MRVGIVQVDGKEYEGQMFPNIALMKVAAYHLAKGDTVGWYEGELWRDYYDKVYVSKIFSFSEMPLLPDGAIIGGTGIDFKNTLPPEIEAAPISYHLYPKCDFHVGFSMKGCRYKCAFCCVPIKEGKPKPYNTIDELLANPIGGNRLMLLDNDFFGGWEWEKNLKRIIELKLKVCFAQGINMRIITRAQIKLLKQARYYNVKFKKRYFSFAWDRFLEKDEKLIRKNIAICIEEGIPASHMQFFVLIGFDTTHEQNMYRVMELKKLGCLPFVMPFNKEDPYQQAFTRWVNQRAVFNSCSWEDYKYNKKWN